MNQGYLDKIINEYKRRCSYQKQSSSNYSNYDYSSYFKLSSSNYTNIEREQLKKFYRALAVKFHPDANLNEDSTEAMKLLNKLKDEWGV